MIAECVYDVRFSMRNETCEVYFLTYQMLNYETVPCVNTATTISVLRSFICRSVNFYEPNFHILKGLSLDKLKLKVGFPYLKIQCIINSATSRNNALAVYVVLCRGEQS